MPFMLSHLPWRLIAWPHVLLPFVLTSHLNFEHTYVHNGVEQFRYALVALVQLALAPIFIVSSALWTFVYSPKNFFCVRQSLQQRHNRHETMFMHTHNQCELSRAFYLLEISFVFYSVRDWDPFREPKSCDEDRTCVHVIANRRNQTHECIGRCCCLPARRQPSRLTPNISAIIAIVAHMRWIGLSPAPSPIVVILIIYLFSCLLVLACVRSFDDKWYVRLNVSTLIHPTIIHSSSAAIVSSFRRRCRLVCCTICLLIFRKHFLFVFLSFVLMLLLLAAAPARTQLFATSLIHFRCLPLCWCRRVKSSDTHIRRERERLPRTVDHCSFITIFLFLASRVPLSLSVFMWVCAHTKPN